MPKSHKPDGGRASTGQPAIRIVNVSLIAVDLFPPVFWSPDCYAMAAAWLKGIDRDLQNLV